MAPPSAKVDLTASRATATTCMPGSTFPFRSDFYNTDASICSSLPRSDKTNQPKPLSFYPVIDPGEDKEEHRCARGCETLTAATALARPPALRSSAADRSIL